MLLDRLYSLLGLTPPIPALAVRETADRVFPALLRKVARPGAAPSDAELRGYIRARAGESLVEEVDAALGEWGLAPSARRAMHEAVLELLIERTVQRVKTPAASAARLRRAA